MTWKGESRRHSLSRKGIKTAGKPNLNARLQKKFGRPKENIEDIIRNEIQDIISFNDLDAKIIDVKLWGSYLKGKETSESDLDFLLEYEGEEREDDMFNVINDEENKIYLEGVPVDVNPIKAEKSGTIKEFLARGEMIAKGKWVIKVNRRIQKADDKYYVYDEDDYWGSRKPFSNMADARKYATKKNGDGKDIIASYSGIIRD